MVSDWHRGAFITFQSLVRSLNTLDHTTWFLLLKSFLHGILKSQSISVFGSSILCDLSCILSLRVSLALIPPHHPHTQAIMFLFCEYPWCLLFLLGLPLNPSSYNLFTSLNQFFHFLRVKIYSFSLCLHSPWNTVCPHVIWGWVYYQTHSLCTALAWCQRKCEEDPGSTSSLVCWGEGKDSSKYKRQTMLRAIRRPQTRGRPGADKADWMAFSNKEQKGLHGEGSFWTGPLREC